MKNKTLDEIKSHIVRTLNEKYGYCGLADGEKTAMINSGNTDEEIIITIKQE